MARKETVAKSQSPGIAQLANAYISSLQQIGAGGPRSKFASAMAEAAAAPSTDFGDFKPIEQPDSGGIGQWLLDKAMRPLYASAGFAKAAVHNVKDTFDDTPGNDMVNPFVAAKEGFIDGTPTTYADVIDEALPTGWGENQDAQKIGLDVRMNVLGIPIQPNSPRDIVKGVGGLAGDIALDPSNLVAAGVIGAVAKGAKAVKGAGKAAEIAQQVAPKVDSVTGVSPVETFIRESPEPAPVNNADAGLPAQPSVADQIVKSADVPLDPAVIPSNQVRKAAEPTHLDNFSMGVPLQDFTSKASKAFDSAERAKPKPPSYINEINPDEYAAAVNFVRGGDFAAPRHLADWFDIDTKTAQRYLSMMEKDGIVEPIKAAAKRQGKAPNAYISRNVINKGQGVDDLNLMINQAPVTPESRAAAIYDNVMPEMKAHFDDLANKGIQPRVEAADGSTYTLSTSDILESLPRDIVEQLNFGGLGKSNLYPSQWHAGAAQALRMRELGVAPDLAAQEVANAMRSALRGNASRKVAIESTGNLSRAAEALVQHSNELAARVTVNAKKFGTKNTIDTNAITETKLQEIDGALRNGTTADAIGAVSNVGRDIAQDSRGIGATNDASIMAAQQIAPEVAKRVPEADAGFARMAVANESTRVREGFSPTADEKVIKRLNRQYVLAIRDAEQLAKDNGIVDIVLGQKHQLVMNNFMERLMHPIRNSLEQGYRAMGKEQLWRGEIGKAEHEQVLFRRYLRTVSEKYEKPLIEQAWTSFRRGVVPSDPQVFGAYTDLQGAWNHIFGNGLRGRFFRNGASLDAINSALDEVGVSYRFKKPVKIGDHAKVPDQMRDWDIKDPLSDMEKINKAAVLIEARQTVAASFAHEFGSNVPKPGYVRVKFTKNSKLGPFLDKSLFYPRDAGEAIYQLDRLVSVSTTVEGKSTLASMVRLLDSVMRVWKPFMTIARPGFVPRNMLSDAIMGYFNGVKDFGSYSTAAKALGAAGEFTDKATGLGGLAKLTDTNYASGSATAFVYKGKPLSYQGLYKLAHENGLMQSWHSAEDIVEQTGTIAEKMMDNGYMRAMGKANEVEGQFARLAHFTDLLKRGQSVEKAAQQVRKFHPDVHGLTPFETKYMRRIFPFYTWLRQAMPVVLTTMVTKPGRVSSVFKAEYNAAIAMGINPDSVIDPFPDDKLYPSFVRDNLVGPMFGDVGLNLGTPQEGVLQDVLQGNPARNIGGMLNPLVKGPYELATRTSVGTGGNIADVSDYVDSQIPIVNQIANISGHSITGLGAEQRAVEMGEKNKVFNLQMVNFLTGLGLQDYGKPSYKRFAAKEADL